MYQLFRPVIFALPPETAHNAALRALRLGVLPRARMAAYPSLAQTVWGLSFAHPVGLAAGFDKNAEAYSPIAKQGMAFVECGTVTPKPQAGNPKPRMFRIKSEEAVINRLGFNNKGLDVFATNLAARKQGCIVGANIGKNKDTEDAVSDYVTCLTVVYPYADYITVNISSPNTPGLRDLQTESALRELVTALYRTRVELMEQGAAYKPILVKIAPDLSPEAAEAIAHTALNLRIDGLIISNTTISRPLHAPMREEWQTGGLSGRPLMPLATETLARVARITGSQVPLVGVGGIASAEDAYAKILHGATLVQLYSALIYQGFGMVPRVVQQLDALRARDGFSHISEAIGKAL